MMSIYNTITHCQRADMMRDIGLLDSWYFRRYFLRDMLRRAEPPGLFSQIYLLESHNYFHKTR